MLRPKVLILLNEAKVESEDHSLYGVLRIRKSLRDAMIIESSSTVRPPVAAISRQRSAISF